MAHKTTTLHDLPEYLKKDILEYIEENKIKIPVSQLTPYELIEYWLEWNGIKDYTDSIIELVRACYKGERG